ncbi:hypothetical protein EYZ11_012628 [Aspergillus tanneri]|uniref:Uncharacterized protein n=1 Tax=Aspergillus tanneri TaxID=1220188 RepID=A0A4S3IZS0_9EURO|nr:hypothetical protein EYZ11_012628 [Aspergillus tanneri]
MLARANGSLEALKSILESTCGGSLAALRSISCAVVIPQLLGVFKGTTAVALDTELYLLPIGLQMQQTSKKRLFG